VRRRGLGAAVLIVWLSAVGLLVRREVGRGAGDPLADAAFSLPPSATYFTLRLGDRQVGFASSTIDTLADTLRVTDITILEVPAADSVYRTDLRTEAVLSRGLRLRAFGMWMRGDGARYAVRGTVQPDSSVEVEVASDAHRETFAVPSGERRVLSSLLPLNLAFSGALEVGQSYTSRIFDPMALTERVTRYTVSAESTFIFPDSAMIDSAVARFVPVSYDTLHAWRVHAEDDPTGVELWIDDLGQIVHATTPSGYVMERTAFELAYENYRRETGPVDARTGASPSLPGNVVRVTAITARGPFASPAVTGSMHLRLGGVPLGGFALDGPGQTRSGDTITIAPPSVPRATYRLPSIHRDLRAYREPEPLLQSDDPRIQAQARQIIAGTSRPERAARLLADWVAEHLQKQVAWSAPSALEALDRRQGDGNEHAVLYVALARAVGLPARTVTGVMYVAGAFHYHAWAEVYLSEWVAVDPTYGQFPADAGHLRLAVGGLVRQLDMMQRIGQLTIDVLDLQG